MPERNKHQMHIPTLQIITLDALIDFEYGRQRATSVVQDWTLRRFLISLMDCATAAAWLRQSLSASARIVQPLSAIESTVRPSTVLGASNTGAGEENHLVGSTRGRDLTVAGRP